MLMETELNIAFKIQIKRYICKEQETAIYLNKITHISFMKFKDAMLIPKMKQQHVLHHLILIHLSKIR